MNKNIDQRVEEFGNKFADSAGYTMTEEVDLKDCEAWLHLNFKQHEDQIREEERNRIRAWVQRRCEANIADMGTDKWNGEMVDLLTALDNKDI